MNISLKNHGAVASAAILACWLGGCSMGKVTDLFTAPAMPRIPSLSTDLAPFSQKAPPPVEKRFNITQSDLIGPDGACAPPTPDSATGQSTGVTLGMPECGLVQLLGQPEQLDIGADEGGSRTVTMLYNKGERPGRYRFSDGQLKTIERVAEPAPPPKPKKPAPAAKPRRTA